MVCGKISTGDPTRQYVGSGQMSGRRVGSGRVGSGRVEIFRPERTSGLKEFLIV